MGIPRLDPGPVAVGLLLALVGWHTATVVGGVPAALLHAVAALVLVTVGWPLVTDAVRADQGWVLPVLVGACAVVLVVAFVLGPPAAWDGALGVGSDRADALDVALARLEQGRYPYAATTYLGNPITPLPGALLLAAPFRWLAGHAAWQNVGWTLLLLPLLTGRRLRPEPTVLWALTVLGGLEVIREFLIGDDLVTGSVPALAATAWTLRAARGAVPMLVVAAAALGVATCTRPHLALVVVVVAAAAGWTAGARRGLVVGGTAAAAWAVLVVPFLLGGTARFSPLHVAAKVTGDRSVTLAIVLVAAGALALLVLVLRALRPTTPAAVGWFCAAILAVPSLLSLAHQVVGGPPADLTLGAGAVPFALWAVLAGQRDRSTFPGPDGAAGRPTEGGLRAATGRRMPTWTSANPRITG